MSVLADHTILPLEVAEGVGSQLQDLADVLNTDTELSLVTADGRTFALTGELRSVLAYAGKALSQGQALTLEPHRSVLSTQEAADLLGVSRPTLVKLLEAGEIAYTKPGRHRRVNLTDLLAYQEQLRAHRHEELAAMSAEAAEDDAYHTVGSFIETR